MKLQVLLALLMLSLLPSISTATTVDECLQQAHDPTAERKCTELIDSGSANAEVYVRLAQALNANGKRSESFAIIEEGLSKFRENRELTEIREIVRSNLSEEEFIQSQKRAQPDVKMLSKGKLRVTRAQCLKGSGQSALDACNDFIGSGTSDSEVSARQQQLLTLLEPTVPPSPEVPEVAAPAVQLEPRQPSVPESAPTEVVSTELPEANTGLARRALVKDIQTALNNLGFHTGTPDGLAGEKTYNAIERFYLRTGIKPARGISPALLADIELAQTNATRAQELFSKSRIALTENVVEEAETLLNAARATAPWLPIPTGLEQSVEQAVTSARLATQQAKEHEKSLATVTSMVADAKSLVANNDFEQALSTLDRAQSTGLLTEEIATTRADIAARKKQISDRLAEQERIAKAEQERIVKAEQERIAKAEQERVAKAEQERIAKAEQERIAKAEQERVARAEQERRAAEESILEEQQLARRNRVAALVTDSRTALSKGDLTRARELVTQALQLLPDDNNANAALTEINNASDPGITNTIDSDQLAVALQQAKVMRAARERKMLALNEYLQQTVPAIIDRLFGQP